jgi:hypothetical protein
LHTLNAHTSHPTTAWLAAAQQQHQRAFAAIGTDTSDDTHDDFKPKFKNPPTADGDVEATIKKDIADNKVFIYMKVRMFRGLASPSSCKRARPAVAVAERARETPNPSLPPSPKKKERSRLTILFTSIHTNQ